MNFAEYFTPQVLWVIVGLLLLAMELAAPFMIIFMFGLGALLTALVLQFFNLDFTGQLGCFFVASIAFLIAFRRLFKNMFRGKTDDKIVHLNSLINEFGVVSQNIAKGSVGQVKCRGSFWSATADEDLAVGTAIVVVEDNLASRQYLHVRRSS